MPATSAAVLTLASLERHGWINPELALMLVKMATDKRFSATFGNVLDYRPHEYARNTAMVTARSLDVEWLVMLDNDIVPRVSPLDIISAAPPNADVVGVRYGVTRGPQQLGFFPEPSLTRETFAEVDAVGGGVLCIRSSVWKRLPKGPWFQWKTKANSETLECEHGEDVSFCNLVRACGMHVFVHQQLAGHLRAQDITAVTCMMAQPAMQRR